MSSPGICIESSSAASETTESERRQRIRDKGDRLKIADASGERERVVERNLNEEAYSSERRLYIAAFDLCDP